MDGLASKWLSTIHRLHQGQAAASEVAGKLNPLAVWQEGKSARSAGGQI